MSDTNAAPGARRQDPMVITTSAIAQEYVEARAAMKVKEDNIGLLLAPAVHHWASKEPVPCGHSGGWSLDSDGDGEGLITDDGKVRLIHQCFFAHQYDLDTTYRTEVSPQDLLANVGHRPR